MAQLERIDFEGLLDEAYATMTTETKLVYPTYK
jgi:hypothetical protein